MAEPGAYKFGNLTWSNRGREIGSTRVTFDMRDPLGGELVINCAVGGVLFEQRVRLTSVPCGFGGRRWWLVCPIHFRYCDAVAFANGRWASREAQRLTYASQSEDRLGRAVRAREKTHNRLLGHSQYPLPRGANRQRLVERHLEQERYANAVFTVRSARLLSRLGVKL